MGHNGLSFETGPRGNTETHQLQRSDIVWGRGDPGNPRGHVRRREKGNNPRGSQEAAAAALRRSTHVSAAQTPGTRGQARTKLRARGGKETGTGSAPATARPLPRPPAGRTRPKAGDGAGTGGRGRARVKRDGVPVPQDERVEAGGGEGGARFGARGGPPNHTRRRG